MGAAPSLKDLRKHIRYKPEAGSLPDFIGILRSESRNHIDFRLVDYSAGGIGIRTSEPLLPDFDYVLLPGDDIDRQNAGEEAEDVVYLTLVWGMSLKKTRESDDGYRYGLKVTGGAEVLKRIFNLSEAGPF
ncbi:MAG: hypothetical protein H6618_04150 [Deltaproteobacteria bacterium]|nr:hypothetical protein [Deltaproteobacteria bacterium]